MARKRTSVLDEQDYQAWRYAWQSALVTARHDARSGPVHEVAERVLDVLRDVRFIPSYDLYQLLAQTVNENARAWLTAFLLEHAPDGYPISRQRASVVE